MKNDNQSSLLSIALTITYYHENIGTRPFPFNIELIRALVNAGADVNYSSGNDSDLPLLLAIEAERIDIVESLLQAGATVIQFHALICF